MAGTTTAASCHLNNALTTLNPLPTRKEKNHEEVHDDDHDDDIIMGAAKVYRSRNNKKNISNIT